MTDYAARIYLKIRGDFDPFEFAKRIPLEPATCIDKHTHNPERRLPRTILLDYADTRTDTKLINLYTLTDQCIDSLKPFRDEWIAAVTHFHATIVLQVVLYFPMSEKVSTPIFGFSAGALDFIASLGGSIDVDTYRA